MIGFIKWMLNQYQISKLKPTQEQYTDYKMRQYMACLEAGFTQEQLLALDNFFNG